MSLNKTKKICMFIYLFSSKVFLGHKNGKPDQVFAVKVMKKKVMVNKNMMQQGTYLLCFYNITRYIFKSVLPNYLFLIFYTCVFYTFVCS